MKEYQKLLSSDQPSVLKVTDLVMKLLPSVKPTWRTPPPDDISFDPAKLAAYSERTFEWALRCRRDLKKLLSESDIREYVPQVEVLAFSMPAKDTSPPEDVPSTVD